MNNNYTTFQKPLEKKEAILLLETLSSDLKNTEEKLNRAIVWARERVNPPVPYKTIAHILGLKSHSRVIQIYNELKGGEKHEQY